MKPIYNINKYKSDILEEKFSFFQFDYLHKYDNGKIIKALDNGFYVEGVLMIIRRALNRSIT